MIETTPTLKAFEKKIVPYLDGALSKEELAEFEAFVRTHPELSAKVRAKQEELQLLTEKLPAAVLSPASREALENEMRTSIFNLLREEPEGLFDGLRIRWEEFRNRGL
jgi:hypothetical protein